MKLINLSHKQPFPNKAKSRHSEAIKEVVEHLRANAQPGVPYSVSVLLEETNKQELLDFNPDDLIVMGAAINELVADHDWRVCATRCHFCLKGIKTSLKDIIQHSTSTVCSYDTHLIAGDVGKLVGEEPVIGAVRKALQRLVKQGRFIRVDRGVYQKTVRGF